MPRHNRSRNEGSRGDWDDGRDQQDSGDEQQQVCGMCCEDSREKLDTIFRQLTGGDDPEKGYFFRLSQLEQDKKRQDWWVKTGVGGAFVALCGTVIAWITGGGLKHQ